MPHVVWSERIQRGDKVLLAWECVDAGVLASLHVGEETRVQPVVEGKAAHAALQAWLSQHLGLGMEMNKINNRSGD